MGRFTLLTLDVTPPAGTGHVTVTPVADDHKIGLLMEHGSKKNAKVSYASGISENGEGIALYTREMVETAIKNGDFVQIDLSVTDGHGGKKVVGSLTGDQYLKAVKSNTSILAGYTEYLLNKQENTSFGAYLPLAQALQPTSIEPLAIDLTLPPGATGKIGVGVSIEGGGEYEKIYRLTIAPEKGQPISRIINQESFFEAKKGTDEMTAKNVYIIKDKQKIGEFNGEDLYEAEEKNPAIFEKYVQYVLNPPPVDAAHGSLKSGEHLGFKDFSKECLRHKGSNILINKGLPLKAEDQKIVDSIKAANEAQKAAEAKVVEEAGKEGATKSGKEGTTEEKTDHKPGGHKKLKDHHHAAGGHGHHDVKPGDNVHHNLHPNKHGAKKQEGKQEGVKSH